MPAAGAQGATGLTSIEAAALGYGEAVKWRDDAVFWYMVPHTVRKNHLDPDWTSNDRSRYWLMTFSNPETDEELHRFEAVVLQSIGDLGPTAPWIRFLQLGDQASDVAIDFVLLEILRDPQQPNVRIVFAG